MLVYNIFVHDGVRWEHRDIVDTDTMIAFNNCYGRDEDEVYINMMADFRYELEEGTPYFYTNSRDPSFFDGSLF